MRLLTLTLRNFKGIREFTLDAGGGDVSVYGQNATGKTTIADALSWLLFDKDSANRKDFEIKTLGPDGEPHHNLEHEVEAVLHLEDGRTLTLRKVYSETWAKRRGSARREFTGHTTDHFVDSVPVKKNEYVAQLGDSCDEDTFRLLTNPLYFNEQLHWQRRREVLLDVCGDITDADVIASDKALAKLPEILGDRKLEDHRKVIAARRRVINEELERIPVRIAEVERGLPDVSGLDKTGLEKQVAILTGQREAKQQELARIEAGGEIAAKRKALAEVEAKLQETKNAEAARYADAVEDKQSLLRAARSALADAESEIARLARSIEETRRAIATADTDADTYRREWQEENGKEFGHPAYEAPKIDETCPACGQALPAEQVESAHKAAKEAYNQRRAQAQETFEREKKAELARLTEAGKTRKARCDELRAEIEEATAKLTECESVLSGRRKEVEGLTAEVDALAPSKLQSYTESDEYKALDGERTRLDGEIATLKDGSRAAERKTSEELARLEADMDEAKSKLALFGQHDAGKKRQAELADEEKRLAAEFEALEEELYLCEQFVRVKVGLLTDKINGRFDIARFKLFDELVNGGVEECCELVVGGVPYSSLNNGARINAGLDIIRTLSEHYGFSAPVFIDNAEAVCELASPGSQLITLYVSEADKKLRVEVAQQVKEVVA